MLRQICSLVYRMGFRPKPGTVLYSPSTDLLLAHQEADFYGSITKGFMDARKSLVIQPNDDLYQYMHHCVVCGSKLEQLVLDIKECPNGHGNYYATANTKGLPIITFEPTVKSTA